MPRTTRAALRSKELAEEESLAASAPLPPTPLKERVPLGEIANNQGAGLIVADSAETEPVKQGGKKGRKAKGAKKGNNKSAKNTENNTDIEILEDGNQSSASSAAEEAREDLVNNQGDQILSVTDQLSTAPSPAANMASEQLKPMATPEVVTEHSQPQHEEQEMTYARKDEPGQADVRTGEDEVKEDSFVKQITSRSPAKRVSRIEDSVEALDRLEDEIEKVGQAITPPPTSDGLPPPPKTEQSKLKSAQLKANDKAVKDKTQGPKAASSKEATETSKSVKRSVPAGPKGIKPKENRASLLRQGIKPTSPVRAEKPAATATKTKAPSTTTKTLSPAPRARKVSPAAKVPSQLSNSTTNATAPSNKRVSSVTRAPFQPAKSTKAPTQSTFELPGEAISRRKKEQREERLKKEEEEKLSKRSFKARPMSMGHAPEVRMTTATKARLSVAKQQPSIDASLKPTKRPSPLTSSISSLSSIRRSSSLTVPKRTTPLANSTARRAPSRSSVSGEPRAAPTAEDVAQAKVKGKEAFSRPKNEIAAREKERREKEEAAKKARIDAAERGRAASREWAEKQKARKAAEAAAKGTATA